ncbi:2-isopropylmalate synthase [Haloplanus vescus]|uniref:2-isopropylmalate synthase n=1 Tax=Haloplanus vescus TaxID=555874 RepID=A0A1H3Y8K6_9EURY|nr:citramalate synthase [Haloplanus vescus]SEA07188.1 2-isopropylmalate synthase [Haloplanus vescus]
MGVSLRDVTIREGAQMPGREYGVDARVEAGEALDRLGVDAIQAGFPVVGETDREAIRQLSESVDADVVGLARARMGDVEAALDADADVIEVIVPTSERQLEHVLGESREAALSMAGEALDRARDGGAAAHLTFVDGFRTPTDRLVDAVAAFPSVPTITVADTVGARTPDRVRSIVSDLCERMDGDRLGVHFHDDLGVAVANTLAAVGAGATTADVSVAALGERAGNAALERVVVADAVDGAGDCAAAVDRAELVPACRAALDALGESVDPRTPVLGDAVTTHESGIHTAAMLDDPGTFEPFDPATFGGERRLVFGAGSGRGSARALLSAVGVDPTEARVATLLDRLAERGPLDAAAATALAESTFETPD